MENIDLDFSNKVLNLLKIKRGDSISDLFTEWSPMMWYAARFTAQTHGIAPRLYKFMADHQILEQLDENFRAYITDQYNLNRLRIEKIQQALRIILEKAAYHKIPVMPLKGSILINCYYSDPALRPMSDIDFLIYPDDEQRFCHLLESLGYESVFSYKEKVYTNSRKVVSFDGEHPNNPIKIEVNNTIKWPIGHLDFDITDIIWDKSENNFLGFSHAFSPSQERLLLMLICHIAGNQFKGRLRTFHLFDVPQVTRLMDDEQWSSLNSLVKSKGLERNLFTVLTITKRFIDIDIPNGLIEEQKWNTPHQLQHHVQTQSIDSLIAFHEFKLFIVKLKNGISALNKIKLRIHHFVVETIAISMQLNWFFPGKEKRHEILRIISTPLYMKDRHGIFLAYIFYLILRPIILLIIIFIGTHETEILRGKLKLRLLKLLSDPYEKK